MQFRGAAFDGRVEAGQELCSGSEFGGGCGVAFDQGGDVFAGAVEAQEGLSFVGGGAGKSAQSYVYLGCNVALLDRACQGISSPCLWPQEHKYPCEAVLGGVWRLSEVLLHLPRR